MGMSVEATITCDSCSKTITIEATMVSFDGFNVDWEELGWTQDGTQFSCPGCRQYEPEEDDTFGIYDPFEDDEM